MTDVVSLGDAGRVFDPPRLERVTILGMGASSALWFAECYANPQARPPTHQVWTLNSGCLVWNHDLVFNMHDLYELREHEPEKDFLGLYAGHDRPLISVRSYEEVSNSWEYPYARVFEEFQEDYFAGGPPYMVALALLCGAKQIDFYGLDFNYPNRSDYEAGRACLEYWMGLAKGMGVVFQIPTISTLGDTRFRYGDGKGQMGYGAVYGFFDNQPRIKLNGKTGRYEVVGYGRVDESGSSGAGGEETGAADGQEYGNRPGFEVGPNRAGAEGGDPVVSLASQGVLASECGGLQFGPGAERVPAGVGGRPRLVAGGHGRDDAPGTKLKEGAAR